MSLFKWIADAIANPEPNPALDNVVAATKPAQISEPVLSLAKSFLVVEDWKSAYEPKKMGAYSFYFSYKHKVHDLEIKFVRKYYPLTSIDGNEKVECLCGWMTEPEKKYIVATLARRMELETEYIDRQRAKDNDAERQKFMVLVAPKTGE